MSECSCQARSYVNSFFGSLAACHVGQLSAIVLKKSASIPMVKELADIEILTLSRGFRIGISRSGVQKYEVDSSIYEQFLVGRLFQQDRLGADVIPKIAIETSVHI